MRLIPLLLLLWAVPASGADIVVTAGVDNLQTAINNADCGDTLLLTVGNHDVADGIILPEQEDCTTYTTITTQGLTITGPRWANVDDDLVCDTTGMATVRSTNTGYRVFRTQNYSNYWRITGLHVTPAGGNSFGIIAIGDDGAHSPPATLIEHVPHHFEIIGNVVRPTGTDYNRRGIALNGQTILVKWNCVENIHESGADSQGVGGWTGLGDFDIIENGIEAAGENILFGGNDPYTYAPYPVGIRITGNFLTKQYNWVLAGFNVKNLLELKSAREVTITYNTLVRNWPGESQDGFGVLFTIRNQSGGCPLCDIDDVLYERNTQRYVGACYQISGRHAGEDPSGVMSNITIRNNLCETTGTYSGDGKGFLIGNAPQNLTIENETIISHSGHWGFMALDNPIELMTGAIIRNIMGRYGTYGIKGAALTGGTDTFNAYFDDDLIYTNVVLAGGEGNEFWYPTTQLPTQATFETAFVSYAWPYTVNQAGAYAGIGVIPLSNPRRLRFRTSD